MVNVGLEWDGSGDDGRERYSFEQETMMRQFPSARWLCAKVEFQRRFGICDSLFERIGNLCAATYET